MVDAVRPIGSLRAGILSLLAAGLVSGCAVVPRERVEESQRLVRSLRAENARLKDEVVGLQIQNRDHADRALDDLRRLTARDEAIERLERSVRDYQDDRDRLEQAYRRLATSLGRTSDDSAVESTADRPESGPRSGAVVRANLEAGRENKPVALQEDRDDDDVQVPASAGRSSP